MIRKITLLLVILCISMTLAMAGGFQVRLQGQKQTGIGLIGTPLSFGASSIFYNPGSLAFFEGKYDFSLGASGLFSKQVFQKDGTDYQAWSDNPVGTPFYLYGAGKIKDFLAVGVGVYTPFGSTGAWNDSWAGRYLIQNIKLSAIYIQPTVAYNYKNKFGVGAGFIYAIGNVKLQKALAYNENSNVLLEGNGSNIGFNVGIFIQPTEDLHIGVDYRSKIEMTVDNGDATFTIPTSLTGTIPPENKFSAELPLPANLEFGAAYDFNDHFMLAVEVSWVQWSAYKSLDFTFEEAGNLLDSQNPREYKDSWITRIGAQYKINDMFTVRAGGYYDPSPANDNYFTPETVSLNTIAFTLGVSIRPVEGLSIDLSYLQVNGLKGERTYEPADFSGTYKSVGYIPGLGISYTF